MALPDDYVIVKVTSADTAIRVDIPWNYDGLGELYIWLQDTVTGEVFYSTLGDFTVVEKSDMSGDYIEVENSTGNTVDVSTARLTTQDQTYTVNESEALNPIAFTEALDKAIRLIQEISEGYDDQSITSVNPFVIPDKVTRANTILNFDANGDVQFSLVGDLINISVNYAEEWANNDEDVLVSAAAGGNEIDEYSAKHWSIKTSAQVALAAASAAAAATSETNAATSETNAATSETNAATSETNAATSETNAATSETNAAASELKASEWADKAEDNPVETGPDRFSAMHWALKAAGSAGTQSIAVITDEKAFNVQGGGSAAAASQQRDLNTINDPDSIVTSLAANQFTLPAGKYQIIAESACYQGAQNFIYLNNVTDVTNDIIGNSSYANDGGQVTHAMLDGIIDIAGPKTFDIQHYTTIAAATSGLGLMHNVSGFNNIYTRVVIIKIG